MGSLADMLVGQGLKDTAPTTSLAEGFHIGAGLAMQQEQVQHQRAELQQKQAELEATKIEKLYNFMGDARHYENAADRAKHLQAAVGFRNALGISDEKISAEGILGQASDEAQGRAYTINGMVARNELSPADALDLQTNPYKKDALARIPVTPREFMGKDQGLNEAQKEALNRQSQEKQAQARADIAATNNASKNAQNAVQLLETSRGNPAAQQAERDLYAAAKANSLVSLYPDPNKMPQQQVQLLVQELGKIASGGTPTMHELDGLTPNTLTGKLASQYSRLVDKPTAANAGAFIQEYQRYSNALSYDAQNEVKNRYSRILESKRPTLSRSEYDNLKQQYMGRFSGDDAMTKYKGKIVTKGFLRNFQHDHQDYDPEGIQKALGD